MHFVEEHILVTLLHPHKTPFTIPEYDKTQLLRASTHPTESFFNQSGLKENLSNMCFTQRHNYWKNIMEGLNTDKEKDKKAEMSFSSRRLKKTQTATRQEYGIALSPLDYYL